MDLDGSGRWRAPGLGVGAAAEGVADGRGAPQLPRWREQLPAGQVQDDKLLKLLQALLRHPGGLSLEQLLEAGGRPQEDTDTARALQQLVSAVAPIRPLCVISDLLPRLEGGAAASCTLARAPAAAAATTATR